MLIYCYFKSKRCPRGTYCFANHVYCFAQPCPEHDVQCLGKDSKSLKPRPFSSKKKKKQGLSMRMLQF